MGKALLIYVMAMKDAGQRNVANRQTGWANGILIVQRTHIVAQLEDGEASNPKGSFYHQVTGLSRINHFVHSG